MEEILNNPVMYWNKRVADTNLEKFQKVIEQKYNLKFESYWKLHEWSIKNYRTFWKEIWHFFRVISSQPYKDVHVRTGPGFLDNEWFKGAKLNFAENLLHIIGDRLALIWIDELDNEEKVTYAEMFQEVKLYSAAFRKIGLKVGDIMAYFTSSRKEVVFSMLAVASIGATWCSISPTLTSKVASSMMNKADSKFLFIVDSFQINGRRYRLLDYLPDILCNVPSLEKVIIIGTEKETCKTDFLLSHKCIFLDDLLQGGRREDGNVPDIVYEQLPFNHPLCINFTSGTTGEPKAVVHSAGSLIAVLRDLSFTFNMKSGDTYCLRSQVGWILWDTFLPCLSLGVTILIYCRSVFYSTAGKTFWDLLDKYRCTYAHLVTSQVDNMEKMQIIPSPGTKMIHLKSIYIGGNPVRKHNYQYLQTKVKKNLLVGNVYGTTELFGLFSGLNLNMPVHGGEIQIPSLGLDVQCYDMNGSPVIGQRGDIVVCTPSIEFPICLLKDANNTKLNEIYLSKFPGAWVQHDEGWINPKTKGLVIFGRSDDVLKQHSIRYVAADIYLAIHPLDELQDYICVSQRNHKLDCRTILFVKMRQELRLTQDIKAKIRKTVEQEMHVLFVPSLILEVPDIPYNDNNKRMESVVRKIIQDNKIPEVSSIRNPGSLRHFVDIPEVVNYDQQ